MSQKEAQPYTSSGGSSIMKYDKTELSTGWMDQRVGSRFFRILAGQYFGFHSILLIISWYPNRYESSNTTFGFIDFLRHSIYNN